MLTIASATVSRLQLSGIAEGYWKLFGDLKEIIYKDDEHFRLLVTTRIDQYKKAEADHLENGLGLDPHSESILAINNSARIHQEEDVIAAAHQQASTPSTAPALQPSEEAAQPIETTTPKASGAEDSQRGEPTLKLGDINSRLGFTVTCDLLSSLGFDAQPVGAKKLYHEDDFTHICGTIVQHIEKLI